ncbi:uncharacterized protein LOC128676760 isoform X2 [Plodia interpunctella]|uniref:uncharacterized protein LOC128676760 isoform X2 n=1 Tax=Plodia interpunctella TaxID=58824 RepID=UPI002367B0CB|nr:uncharacterized protein LOC128676760 isoform X2 [Plodia interpunctella]
MSRGFHESYYDHACRVISERDILDRNIGDVTLFKAIKKKWNDLFLLSYSDTRAGDLYHSTHAMRLGRSHHYLMHRGSIHPLSKFRNFWDMFILHVFIMHQLFVYLNTTLLLRSVPVLTTYIAKIKMIENTIKKSLPNSLNEEIAWHGFSRFVMRIPYFSGWPREILKKIVYLVEELIFLENTVVVESGVASQGLMIVDSGVLAVYKMHNGNHFGTKPFYDEVEHLIDGDYFGQLSLVTERAISTTTIVAITTCKILFVEKTLFKHLMRNNRDLFYSMQEEVQNEITKLTDEIVE